MSGAFSWLVEPGFFSSSVVQTALLAGGVVACTNGVVGLFVVMRRQSFAGEALGDIGAAGGSGAFLVALNPLWGFVAAALVAAGVIEAFGARRSASRDLATGVVLGAALGIAALFLYFDTTHTSTTGASIAVLFGSLFVIDASTVPVIAALSVGVLVVLLLGYRMLLLSTVSADLAQAKGVPVRLVGLVELVVLAIAVALAALTIGAVLSTALLIGPAATALRIAKRPGVAALAAATIGIAATFLGVLLAYDSYDWPPVNHGWPVSFLVVAVIFAFYLLASVARRPRQRHAKHHPQLAPVEGAA